MMVTRLYQFPPLLSFQTKEIFEPAGAGTTDVVDETPTGLVALNDLSFVTGSFRERVKGYLVCPLRHSESFLSGNGRP